MRSFGGVTSFENHCTLKYYTASSDTDSPYGAPPLSSGQWPTYQSLKSSSTMAVAPPSPPSAPGTGRHNLARKSALCATVVGAVWVIGDGDFSAWKALRHHEPSARIFRSLLQVDLLLWCAAASVWIWRRIVPDDMIRDLLFQPPAADVLSLRGTGASSSMMMLSSSYRSLRGVDDDASAPATPAGDENDAYEDGSAADQGTEGEKAEGIDPRNTSAGSAEDIDLLLVGDGDDAPAPDAHYESDGELDEADARGRRRRTKRSSVPSVASIAGAALDTLLVTLVALFLFALSAASAFNGSTRVGATVAADGSGTDDGNYWTALSRIAAPTFPLLLFLYLSVVAFVPWRRSRGDFWTVVAITPMAPWFPVTFRDGFIGGERCLEILAKFFLLLPF